MKRLVFWLFASLTVLALVSCRPGPPESPTATVDSSIPTERPAPDSTPIALATLPATASATVGPAADAWTIVQKRGRLIIGTSADYPPFAFYDEAFELDGYDVALGRLLGERLGVEVEFKDMAFDGLGGALQVGQIDAAIAAISITDQRRGQMDFSNLYFASDGAALARAGDGIVIAGVEDLAPWRVAVQDGTVYETWLEESAVGMGLLPADNLLIYDDNAKAVEDLRAGFIDVIVADSLPLEVAAQDGSLAIAGRGLNRQRFAVAVTKGSTLLSPINEALFDLQTDGELVRLAERYLNLNQAEVQPLPPVESTPVPPEGAQSIAAGCIDAMTLIAHLSLDDDGMRTPPPVSPGTPFQKSWRIQNNGTCTWTSGYLLTPVGGNVPQAGMSGAATAIQGQVRPGESYDITVDLVSPLLPGVYQGFWSMRAPDGLLFGDRIWVGITVPAQPTPTPPATAAPSAGISFSANRTTIRSGECVQFIWQVTQAESVYFYAQGQIPEQNQVTASGERSECPPATMFYNLRVVSSDGTSDIRSIRIDVDPAPDTPFINSFTVTPNQQIVAGGCVDVRWRVSGDVTNILVTRNDTVLWNGAPLSGTSRDCPAVGEVVYAIEVTGPGGTSRSLENITVVEATPVPGRPTPTIPSNRLPVINSFIVVPNRISAGNCLTVSWSVSGNVSRVQLRRDNTLVLDFAVFSGNVTDCLSIEGSYVYRVDAFNAQGEVVSQQAVATVVR
ncbi:MAG: transporter substrate-binding domain-containing protein [Anaerolineae bacterium]|nr:transporter substrate-binding domain-containing protein [Anaerolineae bacterium]